MPCNLVFVLVSSWASWTPVLFIVGFPWDGLVNVQVSRQRDKEPSTLLLFAGPVMLFWVTFTKYLHLPLSVLDNPSMNHETLTQVPLIRWILSFLTWYSSGWSASSRDRWAT